MKNPEFAEPLGTPLPYSRHEPWTLAPWLTGIIVALVIFVILIPALCSACYHYYSYKLGLDEEIDQEEYLEDDYDEEDYYDDESSESCEDDEKGQTTTRPMALKDRGDEQCERHGSDGSNILRPINSGKGSIITCCPRLFLPTGSVMPSCQLDADLPRLPCGHMGVPTRDIAIQVPRAIPAQENIYDEEGPSSTPSTTADDPHSEISHICNNHSSRVDSRTVTWKSFLSPPSTEESSSSAPYNNERPAQEELLIGGLRSTKCNRCGGYELSRHQGTHSRTPDSTMLQNNHHLHCCGNSATGNGKPSPLTLDSHQLFLHPPSNHEAQEEYLLDQNWCSLAQKLQQAKFSLSSKSLVHPGSPDKKILSNYHGPPHQLRRPKTLLSNGFIIPRPPLPNGIIMNRSTPNLLSESHNNQEAILSPSVIPSAIEDKTSADLNHQAVTMVEDSSELETSV